VHGFASMTATAPSAARALADINVLLKVLLEAR
jgi:hypothetical protein